MRFHPGDFKPHPYTLEEATNGVGPGWRLLAERAWTIVTEAGAAVHQVKEKFGGLRVYARGLPEEELRRLYDQLAKIEAESLTVCEWCGARGELREKDYRQALPTEHNPTWWWYKTLCAEHAWRFYVDRERWWDKAGPS